MAQEETWQGALVALHQGQLPGRLGQNGQLGTSDDADRTIEPPPETAWSALAVRQHAHPSSGAAA
jgi:hypothetical protein